MATGISCKNCGQRASQIYCSYCGQKTNIGDLNLEAFLEEVLNAIGGIKRQLHTFWELLVRPGITINNYVVNAKRKAFQSPITYFIFSLTAYGVFSQFYLPDKLRVFGLKKEDFSHSLTFGGITTSLLILIGMSFIGWLFCGLNWGVRSRRSYNLIESIAVFSFIYGTNFLLDIPVVIVEIETPLLKIVAHATNNNKTYINLLTDIPLIVIIGAMAFDFCKTAGISLQRYLLTLFFGFIYYVTITNLVG